MKNARWIGEVPLRETMMQDTKTNHQDLCPSDLGCHPMPNTRLVPARKKPPGGRLTSKPRGARLRRKYPEWGLSPTPREGSPGKE